MTTHDIKKNLRVFEFWLHKNGLEIHYGFNGAEQTLTANPEQSADLMKKIGLIEDYCGSGDEVAVEVEFENEDKVQLYWPDFVSMFTFSQSDAIECAVLVEREKSLAVTVHPVFENLLKSFKTVL